MSTWKLGIPLFVTLTYIQERFVSANPGEAIEFHHSVVHSSMSGGKKSVRLGNVVNDGHDFPD